MTFETLLEGIGELEFGRNKEQVEFFESKIVETWDIGGLLIFRASLMESSNGDFYIPEQYDDFTIASLIAA